MDSFKKIDKPIHLRVERLVVDSCVSAEHMTGNGIHPQMMPDKSERRLDNGRNKRVDKN